MQNMKKIQNRILILAGALFVTQVAHASEPFRSGYVGVLGGVNSAVDAPDTRARGTIGLTLGGRMVSGFGLGAFLSYHDQTTTGSLFGLPTGSSASTTILTGQLNFFSGGLHLGAEMGEAFVNWSGAVSNFTAGTSTSGLVYGPEIGYDIPLSGMSVGAEAHYLIMDVDGGANQLQALVALKVWI